MKLTPLLTWLLRQANVAPCSRVNNFSSDIKDGENYAVLLAQIGAEYGNTRAPLQTRDLLQRAEEVLVNADKMGCRKFLTPTSLVAGNPKLNLAFVANLFNNHPCLDPITEEEKLEVEDFDAEGEREARVFTLWLNSLDVQPAVQSFFDDLRDGTVLLQAYDKVIKGSVNWRHVNKPPSHGGEMSRFKAVENTNYTIELGKQNGFSLVGIQGADLTDGQRTLTLGLVWQLMRKDITLTLSALAQRLGKREITDSEMVRWANDTSRKGGKSSAIRSFKDPSIGTGVFLLDVLNGMKSSYVDYDLVTPGHTDEDAYLNAKLSISIARKMGATIWLVPEDICQVRSRLVTTFIGETDLPRCPHVLQADSAIKVLSWLPPNGCEMTPHRRYARPVAIVTRIDVLGFRGPPPGECWRKAPLSDSAPELKPVCLLNQSCPMCRLAGRRPPSTD
jgi:plastin-1